MQGMIEPFQNVEFSLLPRKRLLQLLKKKRKTSRSNHWKLPIQINKSFHREANNLVLNVDTEPMTERDLRKHVVKVHKNLCLSQRGSLLHSSTWLENWTRRPESLSMMLLKHVIFVENLRKLLQGQRLPCQIQLAPMKLYLLILKKKNK